MRISTSRWLREVHSSARRWEFSAAILGGVIFWIASSNFSDTTFGRFIEILGEATIAAAVVSFVFGRTALSETTAVVDAAVHAGLRDSLGPVRERMVEHAFAAYRWDTVLERPQSTDSYRDYVVQTTTIGYQALELPDEIRLVCLASMVDGVLEPYARDSRYVFRWEVDDVLDPANPEVFSVLGVWVDGEHLVLDVADNVSIEGGRAQEYRYRSPSGARRAGMHHLQFAVRVLKHVGEDERVRIQVHAFRDLADAEYRLAVAGELGVKRLLPHTGALRTLGPPAPHVPTFEAGRSTKMAVIRCPQGVLASSAVSFELIR